MKSFVLYTEYLDCINMLSLEQQGMLLQAIMHYAADGKVIEGLDNMTTLCFMFIQKQMNRDHEKYATISEKRSEAGKKGGGQLGNKNAKKTKNEQNEQNEHNDNDDVDDNVNDDDINSPPPPTGGEEASPLKSDAEREPEFSEPLEQAIDDWIAHKAEMKQAYRPVGKRNLMKLISEKTKRYGEDAVTDVIRRSIAGMYAGIVWDFLDKGIRGHPKDVQNRFNARHQREYDYEYLEKNLISN